MVTTRSILDVWSEQRNREREKDELLDQASLLRDVGRRRPDLLSAQSNAFASALAYERARLERPSLRPRDYLDALQHPQPIRPPATISREPGAEVPFGGGRGLLDILGGLPLPGGSLGVLPSVSGGKPGVSISGFGQPEERTVEAALEFERDIFQPVT